MNFPGRWWVGGAGGRGVIAIMRQFYSRGCDNAISRLHDHGGVRSPLLIVKLKVTKEKCRGWGVGGGGGQRNREDLARLWTKQTYREEIVT